MVVLIIGGVSMKRFTLRKALSFILAVATLALSAPVTTMAADRMVSGDFTYTVTDGKATVVDYSSYGNRNVIIPPNLGGYPVTAIGSSAFFKDERITSVIIPDSVETIGKSAFYHCTGIRKVTFGNGVKFVDTSAFEYCFELAEVHIKDISAWCGIDFANSGANPLNRANVLYVDGNALYDLEIPDGVERIGDHAFINCGTLSTVSLPDSLKSIGDCAFQQCYSLTGVTIPDEVESIGDCAFLSCHGIMEVTVPAGVKSIGETAFYGTGLTAINVKEGNTSYKSVDGVLFSHDGSVLIQYPAAKETATYIVPSDVRTIGKKAFAYCSKLTEVIVPDSVTSLATEAFRDNKKLTSVIIGNGVTAISDGAFNKCSSLESVTVGKNVSCIGTDAFRDCAKLKDIRIWDIAAWCMIDCTSNLYSNPFYYAENLYLDGELVEDLVIPDSVTSIAESAFEYCESIKSVTVPGTVTAIEKYAFEYCENLTDVTVSHGVTYIGDGAFKSCGNLENVSLPDSVTYIGNAVFSYTKLYNDKDNLEGKLLYIDNHLIGANVVHEDPYFDHSDVREEFIVKEGTVTIASGVFSDGAFIYSVYLPESLTAVCDGAFSGCRRIADVYYGGSKDKWSRITIGTSNQSLTAEGVRIHYDVTDLSTHYECNTVIKEPTCTESGMGGSLCPCGYSIGNITIPPRGHDVVQHDGKAATCTEPGYKAYVTCNKCSYTTYKDIPAKDHSLTEHPAKVPTCTETGWFPYKACEDCDYTTYVELRPYGHTYESGVCKYCGDIGSYNVTSGDVTGDGKVNLTDASGILKYIAKWDISMNTVAADVNCDGKVNLTDVSMILKYIAKWDVVLGK